MVAAKSVEIMHLGRPQSTLTMSMESFEEQHRPSRRSPGTRPFTPKSLASIDLSQWTAQSSSQNQFYAPEHRNAPLFISSVAVSHCEYSLGGSAVVPSHWRCPKRSLLSLLRHGLSCLI